ncbi:DUF4942 domain-containing protein [Yersinia enterocolitica]
MSQNFTDTHTTTMPSIDVNYQPERGELIVSVSIEKIISYREHVLVKVAEAIELLKEAQCLSVGIGGGKVTDWDVNHGRYPTMFANDKNKVIAQVKKLNDRYIWEDLMKKSGMLSLMDDQAHTEWRKNLESGEYPEITYDNIIASFEQLNNEKNKVFERGAINIFKSLSWDYKTNNPCRFGHRIIINNFVEYNAKWGFSSGYSINNKLNDLERILNLLDGKLIPDYRNSVAVRLGDHIRANPSSAKIFDDEYFNARYFKKCSGHLSFKRLDLIEKLNDILVKHYPAALPPRL